MCGVLVKEIHKASHIDNTSVGKKRRYEIVKKGKTNTVKEDKEAIDIQIIENTDLFSPYDLESITLIIQSQDADVRRRQRAFETAHNPTGGKQTVDQLIEASTQVIKLLSWLTDIAALYDLNNTVLYTEVCMY